MIIVDDTAYMTRESEEYLPVTSAITIGDVTTPTTTFDVAIASGADRPSDWHAHPWLMSGIDPGTYKIFTRVTDSPEIPVNEPGWLVVT